jgi:hypothetical protein
MSAIIATLLDIGWDPWNPTLWKDERGGEWDISLTDMSLGELTTQVGESAMALYGRKAVTTRHGQDLAAGAALTVANKLMREFLRQKLHSQYNMLITTVTGSSRTAPHLAGSGRAGPARRYRCGLGGTSDWHLFWERSVLALSASEDICKPQHLLPLARAARAAGRDQFFVGLEDWLNPA